MTATATESKQGVFGIDLGTTYSAVAYIDDVGKPVVVRNSYGDDTTPSVVFFENDANVVVGTVAKETAVMLPDNVVSLVKREMGNADYRRTFFGKEYSAPSVSALILQALSRDAEIDSTRKLDKAVITVPAYFGMLEKAATRQAGEIAGIEVIGIVPEPVAAALAYGLGTDADGKTILVYDLGGGTFDITIMRIGADEIRVLVVDGNHQLGGADWDAVLIEHLVQEVTNQVGDDSIRDDDSAMQEIANLAEKTKRQLSVAESRPAIIRHSGGSAKVTVTRSQFEQMTAHLVDNSIDITRRAIATVDELHPGTMAQVSDVLLVGGSTWMPAIAATLKREFGWDAKVADPDLAVAKGAALYAAGQWGKLIDVDPSDAASAEAQSGASEPNGLTPEALAAAEDAALIKAAVETNIPPERLTDLGKRDIVNALPKAIGIKLVDTEVPGWDRQDDPPPYVHHLVEAQTGFPLEEPVVFTANTVAANQDQIQIEIWEQAGAVAGRAMGENRHLAGGNIKGLAAFNLPASSPVEILFDVNGDGVATVDAREPKSGKKIKVETKIELLDATEMAEAKYIISGLTSST